MRRLSMSFDRALLLLPGVAIVLLAIIIVRKLHEASPSGSSG